MYISTYIRNNNCHQHSYGFQNLMSSWGLGNIIFEITIFTWVFKYLVPKVDGYQVQKKFGIRKPILDFQLTNGFLPFWDLENVLSPGGTLQSRARRWSNCLYLGMFYFVLGNLYWTFNLHSVFCLFETLKMFYCADYSSKEPYIRVFLKNRTKNIDFS